MQKSLQRQSSLRQTSKGSVAGAGRSFSTKSNRQKVWCVLHCMRKMSLAKVIEWSVDCIGHLKLYGIVDLTQVHVIQYKTSLRHSGISDRELTCLCKSFERRYEC